METKDQINKLFTLLDQWRCLPSYQLERRADIFFAIYLKKILESIYDDSIDVVIPEFPIRIGDISDKLPNLNKSFKIDYLGICESKEKVYFIELKTDASSRREKQDLYLKQAQKINIIKLMDGIIKIYGATSHQTKYDNLISLLTQVGWLQIKDKLCTNISKDYQIKVIYFQPNNDNNDEDIITFKTIASVLANEEDDLTKRFVQSLKSWTNSPNLIVLNSSN